VTAASRPRSPDGAREASARSLIDVWLDCSARPLLSFGIVVGLEAASAGALVWLAGWRHVVHAVSIGNVQWFGICAAGQLIAYLGYAFALRAVARVDRGVSLPFPVALAVVCVGFGPTFSANTHGGFSIDFVTLREAGISRRSALCRVLGLGALEYAVLAPVVAASGVLLYLGIDGRASAYLALPWLAVVPGVVAAGWLTTGGARRRVAGWTSPGPLRRGVANIVSALGIVRALIARSWIGAAGFGGALAYWIGDMVTFWAALRVFGVRLPVAELVLAYGTGWALTRRSLPFGGPGVVEILLSYVLTWFHVEFASAAAGVVAYRLFNFWLAFLPASAVMPCSRRVEKSLHRIKRGRRLATSR
jgi:uncharacterized membrane protein YbhN (UPF0104 family)